MTDRLAPPTYRILAPRALPTGGGDALDNVITNPLPDGAQAFVISNRSVYRLDKTSTATADGSTVIAPIAGPGRWILGGGGAGSQLAQISTTTDTSIPDGGADTLIPFTTVDFQAGAAVEADVANNQIIARQPGLHMVVHALNWDGDATNTERRSRAFLNGSAFEPIALSPTFGTDGFEGSFTQFADVAAADGLITLRALQTGVAAGLDVTAARLTVIKLT